MQTKRTALTEPLPASMPTSEFETHHNVTAPLVDGTSFRTAWRIDTRLDGLLDDGLITVEGRDAARRWQRDFEMATERTRTPDLGNQTSSHGDGPAPQLAALARLRATAQALGAFAVHMLELCVIRDLPWSRTAALVGCSDKTARRWTAAAVDALAAHQRLAR